MGAKLREAALTVTPGIAAKGRETTVHIERVKSILVVVVIMPMHGGVLAACGLLICHPDHCMNPRNKNKKKVMLMGRCAWDACAFA